jgi:hypothetical protein
MQPSSGSKFSLWTIWPLLTQAAFTVLLAAAGPALAAAGHEPAKAAAEQSDVWVFAYMVVVLGVALGLIALCRSSRRSDRPKAVPVLGEPVARPPASTKQ